MKIHARLFVIMMFLAAIGTVQGFGQRMMMRSPEERAKLLKDSLSLSDEQFGKVVKIYQDMDQQRKDMFESGSSDRQQRTQAMRDLTDKTDQKIDSLLTDTQKAKYDELKKQRQQRGPGFRRNRG